MNRRPSASYQIGLAVVAVVMVLLPAIYASLILLVGWGVWHHATSHFFLLRGEGGWWFRLPLYFGPMLAGQVLIISMVKPLLAGRPPAPPAVALDADEERSLFAFIARVCRTVGAPLPYRVEVNCAVNAAAGLRRGAASLLGRDMTLTLGLPLVAGLSTRQFAGVLAHEFGHFSQVAGMRLTYVIRETTGWFSRAVDECDRLRFALAGAARAARFPFGLRWRLVRGCVSLSRGILWALAYVGHAVSCYMLRQMEYDADRYECRVAGSEAFRETMLRLRELNLAGQVASAALTQSWRAQRLPDSLPLFIVGTLPEVPPEAREETRRIVADSRTGLFDTHPCDPDRIRAAEALAAPGIVRSTEPATALFRDFASLSRQVTRLTYEKDQALPIQDANLVSTDAYLRETSSLRATRALSERYFGGVSTVFHPVSIGLPELQPPSDPDAGLAELRAARDRMKAAVTRARYAQKQQDQIHELLFNAESALVLLEAGFAIEPAPFGLKAATTGAAREAIATLEGERKQSGAPLGEYDARARARLRAALRQLGSPSQARRIADAQALQEEVARLVPTLEAVAAVLPLLHTLGGRLSLWQTLLLSRGHQADPAIVDGPIEEVAGQLRDLLGQVRRGVNGVRYPFPHARGAITLDQFVEPEAPSQEEHEALFGECLACLDRLFPLYEEALGRLAQIASRVEESLVPEMARGKDRSGAPARDLMDRLREVASRLGPEALAARRPRTGGRA